MLKNYEDVLDNMLIQSLKLFSEGTIDEIRKHNKWRNEK